MTLLPSEAVAQTVDVTLPKDLKAGHNADISVPVLLGDYDTDTYDVVSMDFRFEFDPNILAFVSLEQVGYGTEGWFSLTNPRSPGVISVAMAGINDAGPGVALVLKVKTLTTNGTSSLRLTQFTFNEGVPDDIQHPGSILVDEALPVTWSYFRALPDGMAVNLNWGTRDELNNYGFYIQVREEDNTCAAGLARCSSTTPYEEVAFIQGKGSIQSPSDYLYRHSVPHYGNFAFRIKQVDFDGTTDYTDDLMVAIEGSNGDVLVYPNPFNPNTTISFTTPVSQDISIFIYDILGRQVIRRDLQANANAVHTVTLDFSTLPTGVYLARISGETYHETAKLVYLR